MIDKRQYSPSAERNRGPILEAMRDYLPAAGTVLEVASGSGEHAVYFAPQIAPLKWQVSNLDRAQLDSVQSWITHCPADNLLSPILLDATAETWPVETDEYPGKPVTALFNANMIHISSWNVTEGLFAGAGRILPQGGRMFLYGPYRVNGAQTSSSNVEFEVWLKSLDQEFAIRDQEQVISEAKKNGLTHLNALPMPANNFLQIFEKR